MINTEEDLRALMHEVEQAKNRFSNRAGFSPVQRQIGQWPRIPKCLLTDDNMEAGLLGGMVSDDIERLHEMRRAAQKAFADYNSRQVLHRAVQGRSRTAVNIKPGDYVYVYRVPKPRLRRRGGREAAEVGSNRATWVGPGTVLAEDGGNLWVSMLGELWRVAKEQCRPATREEREGVEAVLGHCKELIEEYKRNPHRAGYRDLTQEEIPEDEPGAPEQEQAAIPAEEDEGYTPSVGEADPPPPDEEERSHAEPEQEDIPMSRQESTREANAEEEAQRRWQEYHDYRREVERRDGISPGRALRLRGNNGIGNPYWCEQAITLEGDEEAEEEAQQAFLQMMVEATREKKAQDYWEVNMEEGWLRRHHIRKRRARYDPSMGPGFQEVEPFLRAERSTQMTFRSGMRPPRQEQDRWRIPDLRQKSEGAWWTGYTEFWLTAEAKEIGWEAVECFAAAKKGQDEVNLNTEKVEDLPEWRKEDRAEWDKVVSSGAVEVMSLEESRRIRLELRAQGQENRILPTKMARRYKPAEQPGVPPKKKSRMCIRGDLDPDALLLERFSPTLNTMAFNLLLQVAANKGFVAECADFANAFCQSQPLHRERGALYFQPPREGIEGVSDETLIKIVHGCYGLVDAPLHWRKTLTAELMALGYRESRMDPCIYLLHRPDTGELLGAIAVEVDDLFMVGGREHRQQVQRLKEKFKFGKWMVLKDHPEGSAFNGRRIKQMPDGEFRIDMQKFVEERLHPVILEKGRAGDKSQLANQAEKDAAGSTCGALNWLAKEGRPDAAGPSSLLSSRISRLTIEDIQSMNEVVKCIKANSEFFVRIQPLQRMKLGVISDASFGNSDFHSQGGHMIIAHERELNEVGTATTNIVAWRSGKLQRVVNSTLAAETQALSRGLGDLLWSLVVLQEYEDATFSLKRWPERLCAAEILAMASVKTSEVLREALAVVDAKSLYDQLSKATVGGSDRRTAIEIQIIREDLNTLSGRIRWVDHASMLADGLTKLRGSNEALYRTARTGQFRIQAEAEHLKAREEARQSGLSQGQLRRSGIKEKHGSVIQESQLKHA